MQKIIFLLFPGLMMITDLSAQTQGGFASGYLSHSMEVFDANGKAFVNPTPDVTGSPFLKDEWMTGTIVSSTGKQYDHVRLRINLLSQEMHFLDKNNNEMVTPAGMVKEIVLYDSAAGNVTGAIFFSGFPPIENRKTTDFYQVICQGKIWLLHSRVKTISVQKDNLSGEVKKEFLLYEDDYVYAGDRMVRLKRDKSFILTYMTDKKDQMEAFIADNHLKLKSVDDIKKAIAYYNSLP